MKKILIVASLLAILDQITKYLATHYLNPGITFIPDWLALRYTENTGVAFSVAIPSFLILFLNILLLLLLIYFAVKEPSSRRMPLSLSLMLIIAGGLGNLIDRLAQGYVVDFISVWKWPLFNLADIYIVVGVLLVFLFYGKIKEIKK